ncbi:MAG: hypothetical protein Tsb0021_16890 [Chlamydiales bacterium]
MSLTINQQTHSIYPNEVLKLSSQAFGKHFLAISKLYATHINKFAIADAMRGNLHRFDPLVRDRCCQVHALHILERFKDQEVRREISSLKPILVKILSKINRIKNQALQFEKYQDFSEFIEDHALNAFVSSKAALLFHAHFLTFCTSRQRPRSIDIEAIIQRTKIQLKSSEVKLLVSISRTCFSEMSAQFIQQKAQELPLKFKLIERLSVVHQFSISEDKNSTRTTLLKATGLFYNTKTALLLIRQRGLLVLLKDPESSVGAYFESKDQGPFKHVAKELQDPERSVIVFLGSISKGHSDKDLVNFIEAKTLEEVVLEEAAAISLYDGYEETSELDEGAKMEVKKYKKQLQSRHEPVFKNILHVYPSTLKQEVKG